ncbi:hypothetical protein RUM43_009415 [Polyplax serrata]|uniref:Uncharacterized protein n=1 Tax=Polyplax serrata TaxID=468196 RepID=A0AAN8PAS1_POLSC
MEQVSILKNKHFCWKRVDSFYAKEEQFQGENNELSITNSPDANWIEGEGSMDPTLKNLQDQQRDRWWGGWVVGYRQKNG